jgi:hypothetical protein
MIQIAKVLTLMVFGVLFINLSAQGNDFTNDPNAKLADEDRKFRFGLQFSPNISWLKANTAGHESEGTKMGFSYGLSFEYFMSKNYLISTGITLLNSGGVLSYQGATFGASSILLPAEVKESYNIKYIEIPLILKLRTNEIGYFSYFGQFGMKMGFNYKSSADYEYTTYLPNLGAFPDGNHSESISGISEEINWLNMSLVIGAGVEYNISGNTSLMLGITYNNGFINQLDSKVPVLDNDGHALIDYANSASTMPENAIVVYSSKEASANLNYIALNIGVYF